MNRACWPLLKVVACAGAEDLPQRVPTVMEPYVARKVGRHNPAIQVSKLLNGAGVFYTGQRDHNQGADSDAIAAGRNNVVVDADIVLRIRSKS